MSSRLPKTQSTFGLIAWLEATKITLPLKGVECRFDVTGGVASVEIDQIFHQSHAEPLDCTYSFPLPAEAAVWRCEMHVNGRVIRAKVEDREHARRIYVEQKAAGRRAAMVEVERDNFFTLSLGNVQPGDVIVIRLAYFQTLERAGSALSLRVPVCPGVRYIPGKPLLRSLSGRGWFNDTDQVPDASRLSPPRIDALDPDAAYFSAEGNIARSDVADGSLSSPTHLVLVREGAAQLGLTLADRGAVPDCDFVVRWSEPREAALQPRAWSFSEGGESYALVQLRAPAEVAVAADFPQDIYFLVDRSGSMAGAKWIKTCEALTAFVKLLGPQNRVWITLFGSAFQDFSEAPMPAPEVLRDAGFRHLVKLGVVGGTEVLPAAKHVLAKIAAHSAGRSATVILITDGQVGNEREVLQHFRTAAGVTVHTFGIDVAVNDAFLKSLARQQGGECWLQTPDDDIAATVAGLADRLRRPVITALELRGAWKFDGTRMPEVHGGQVVTLSLRLPAGQVPDLEIAGRLGDGERHVFPLTLEPCANPALRLLWARDCVTSSLAEGREAAAFTLAKQHNILCEGLAFIAWDEAEQVVIAEREIYQPSLKVHDHMAMGCVKRDAQMWDRGILAKQIHFRTGAVDGRFLSAQTAPEAPSTTHLAVDDALITLGVIEPLARWLAAWGKKKWLRLVSRRMALRELFARLEPSFGDVARCTQIVSDFLEAQLADSPVELAEARLLLVRWQLRVGVRPSSSAP